MPPRSISPNVKRVAATLALAGVLVACEPTGPAPPASRRPDDAPSAVPAGGTITFGVLGEPPSLDPYSRIASDLTYFVARPVYRSLYEVTPEGVVEADLAASLTSDRRGATVTLEPARWSDGSVITAADVAASVARARPPSGFAGLAARVVDRRTVRFSGDVAGDWEQRLAIGSFVVPRAGKEVWSGPFVIQKHVAGLQVVLARNPRYDAPPRLDRIKVQFISDLEIMLALLGSGRLDAAAPPSAVNLDERLDELGLHHAETPGWETIALDLTGTADTGLRSTIVGAVERDEIAEGIVRDEGTVLDVPQPPRGDGGGVEIQFGTASGDELLQLMQRMLQKDLASTGVSSELAQVDPATLYGPWDIESPLDVALRREIYPGFDGPTVRDDLAWFPLFTVESFVAWNDGVNGLAPNGALDGPLWNAEEWWLE